LLPLYESLLGHVGVARLCRSQGQATGFTVLVAALIYVDGLLDERLVCKEV